MRISDWSSDVCSSDLFVVEYGDLPGLGFESSEEGGSVGYGAGQVEHEGGFAGLELCGEDGVASGGEELVDGVGVLLVWDVELVDEGACCGWSCPVGEGTFSGDDAAGCRSGARSVGKEGVSQ